MIGSACTAWDSKPAPGKNQATESNSQNAPTNDKESSTGNHGDIQSGETSSSCGTQPAYKSESTSETVTNEPSHEAQINLSATGVQEEELGTTNMTFPDGRVYVGGDTPFAYTPTCSPKDKGLAPTPLIPDE
jgi:hypothetical protein